MKNPVIIWISILILILFSYCTPKESAVEIVKIDGEELYVCDINKVKDSLILSLSDLIKSLHIITLENKEEALLGSISSISMTDNYIGFVAWNQPFKLFDKGGNYIGTMGAIGRGPGEYTTVSNAQIDEKSGYIYILPWGRDYLFKYNLEGEFQAPIKLLSSVPKGKFQIKNNDIMVGLLPFQGFKYVAFTQDMEGNIIDTIPVNSALEVVPSYNHEFFSSFNGDNLDFQISPWEPRQDTLYHYIPEKHKIVPRFTIPFSNPNEIYRHNFYELPHHYVASVITEVKLTDTGMGIMEEPIEIKNIIVDKKKKEAYFYRIEDDMLFKGDNVDIYRFTNKKFIYNCPAYEFIEKAEKTLARNDISEEMRKKITDVLDGLDENDNNILIWGEMK